MSNRYDHTLGRLDALFEEAKRIRVEVESMKAAEQARVNAEANKRLDAAMDKQYDKCPKCGRHMIPLGATDVCCLCPPAPVVERFVMWGYRQTCPDCDQSGRWKNDPHVWCLHRNPRNFYERSKRCEVVATKQDNIWIIVFRWSVKNNTITLSDDWYQFLKDKQCFGEQV